MLEMFWMCDLLRKVQDGHNVEVIELQLEVQDGRDVVMKAGHVGLTALDNKATCAAPPTRPDCPQVLMLT